MRELIPFFVAALIGLLSVLLPGPETNWTLYALGAGLTVMIAVAGIIAVRLQRGSWLILGGSLAYLVAVALLRHSGIQQAAGYVPLMLLPIVFLALFGSRRELAIGLGGMTLALLVPFLVYGDPQYPNTSWRTTVLFVTVGALTGLSIQMLVARAREAGAFSDAIIDTAGSLVMVLRPDGTIERFNRACEQLTGRTEAEMKGGRPDELVAEHDREAVVGVFERVTAGDFPISFELEWIAADGSLRQLAWFNTCLVDANGEITHVIATGTDITDRRRALAQAVEASRAKSRVPGQHEPRDPHAAERRDRHDSSCCSTPTSTPDQREYARDGGASRATPCSASSTTSSTSRRSRPASSSSSVARLRPARRSSRTSAELLAPSGAPEGPRADSPMVADDVPAARARRPRPPPPGAAEPARQRGQVHRARRGRACAPSVRRRPTTARRCAFAVADTGIGIAPTSIERAVRAVLAGRRLDHPPLRRHRPRARDLAPARRADGRRARRRQSTPGEGSTFCFTARARSRARRAPTRRRAARRSPRACGS